MKPAIVLLLTGSFLLGACAPKTPDPQLLIALAVRQTVAAIPTGTPYPTPLKALTSTPNSLAGIFCEYQFCIGHPLDMAFYDVDAVQSNQNAPSTIGQGILASYNRSLFIQVVWQDASGATDPQFMLDVITQSAGDAKNGNVEPILIGNLNVFYVVITPTPSAASTLPYGGAAAWLCGQRAFAWKAYTPQVDLTKNLLNETLRNFRCATQ